MKSTLTLISATLLVPLPSCGSSSPPVRKSDGTSKDLEALAANAPYRISDAGIMMTSKDADAALRSAGYDDSSVRIGESTHMSKSFEDQVEEHASGKPPTNPKMQPGFEHWKKGRETIDVKYAPYPGDARVVYMNYNANGPSPSANEIQAALEKRYGVSIKEFGIESWCSPAPFSSRSVSLMPSGQSIALIAPQELSDDVAVSHRIDAAARARGGMTKGVLNLPASTVADVQRIKMRATQIAKPKIICLQRRKSPPTFRPRHLAGLFYK